MRIFYSKEALPRGRCRGLEAVGGLVSPGAELLKRLLLVLGSQARRSAEGRTGNDERPGNSGTEGSGTEEGGRGAPGSDTEERHFFSEGEEECAFRSQQLLFFSDCATEDKTGPEARKRKKRAWDWVTQGEGHGLASSEEVEWRVVCGFGA